MYEPTGAANMKKLDDGTIAQGVVILAQTGEIADAAPLLQQDLIGNARGYYPDKSRGFVFGKKTGLNNTVCDMWEGPTALYVFPNAPMQMALVSSSINDAAAGTGVQAVHIHYLDHSYQPKTVAIITNGTTPVLTVPTDILRINGMHAIAVGSGQVAAGNISLTNVAGTVTYAYIAAGYNTARQAIYTVPDGMWGYINHWQASSGSANNHFCQISIKATTHAGEAIPVFLLQDETGTQNGGISIDFPTPIPIPPRTDVKMSAVSDASNAAVTALGAIMGWFEPGV